MEDRQATIYIDYQQRAKEFSVGDMAYPLAGSATDESQAGRVVAVYPGIGQVDIEFPWGSGRYPVEDVQRVTGIAAKPPDEGHTTVPGGVGTVRVPGGPEQNDRTADIESLDRVAFAWVKSALYWASKNRNYRATKEEREAGKYACPKCGPNEETGGIPHLRPANYKRNDGVSYRLMGCPHCLFLIKRQDIMGDSDYVEDVAEEMPAGTLRAEWDETMDQGFDSVQNVTASRSPGQFKRWLSRASDRDLTTFVGVERGRLERLYSEQSVCDKNRSEISYLESVLPEAEGALKQRGLRSASFGTIS